MKKLLSIFFSLFLFVSVAKAEFFSDIIVTSPNAIWTDSRAYSTLNDAIAAVGANERTIVIVNEQTVTDLTIPSNISLIFFRNGSINNSGQLTIQTTNIQSPSRQIFTGTGDIDFAQGSVIKSGWFSNFVEAVNQTTDDELTLIVSEQSYITTNCALGNNITLKWNSPRNRIVANAGFEFSNISKIEAGNYQLFAGAGDFDFVDGISLNLSWFNRLRSILAWVETERITLKVSGVNVIDYNETIPNNVILDFTSNHGSFSISAGVTLNINGKVFAGNTSFTGSGTVTCTDLIIAGDHRVFGDSLTVNLTEVNALWFGASPTETGANNATYLQNSINALSSGGHWYLKHPGTYSIATSGSLAGADYIGMEFTTSNTFIEFGPNVTISGTVGSTYLILIHGIDRTNRISNIVVQGGIFSGSIGGTIGITVSYTDNCVIRNTITNDFSSDGISFGGGDIGVVAPTDYDGKILNCSGTGNGVFGIIVNKIHTIEVANCDFSGSGDSDIDVKNCANFNVHDNKFDGATEYGINVRCSMYGQDVYGQVVNNWVGNTSTKAGIYIHHDTVDEPHGVTGELRDIIVANNEIYNTEWSGISIVGSTGHQLYNTTITGNIIKTVGNASPGVSLVYITGGTFSGNLIDLNEIGYHGLTLAGAQEMTISGNTILRPGDISNNRNGIELNDAPDGTTFSMYNFITGNTLIRGDYGALAVIEEANADYNRIEGNFFYGWNTVPAGGIAKSYIRGANSAFVEDNYWAANTPISHTGTIAGTSIINAYNSQYEFGIKGKLKIRVSGRKTGSGGSKTLRFYFGTNYVEFHPAANNETDWEFIASLSFTAINSQTITWRSYDDGVLTGGGVEVWNSAAGSDFILWGDLNDVTDSIIIDDFTIDRIK